MKTNPFYVAFLMLLFATSLWASDTQVDGIWYDFYSSTHTATVTFRGANFDSYSGEYSGQETIPSVVNYNNESYSVTSIGHFAFYKCSGLTSVIIPNSVTSIGDYAFYECTGLTSVTIPNSVTSIGERAFENCIRLTSVTIGNSVTSIGGSAFSGCYRLTSVTIPNSVTSIGWCAFYHCDSLTSVTIGNSVTSIGHDAFNGCTSLTSVTIPNSVTSIGSSAFSDCKGLISVTIPNSVTSIGREAFSDCSGLTSVTIPNSVTSIGDKAFRDCTGLTQVNITDLAAWCNIAFDNISSNPLRYAEHLYVNDVEVSDLVIPNSVTSIGHYAFYNCRGLTSVTIGNSVTSIGKAAFYFCTGLTSVTIGNSVTSIGSQAFYFCTSLTSVHISDIAAWCAISFGNQDANPLYYAHNLYLNDELITNLVILDNVTSIGNYAFYYCTSLTSVTIGNSVKSIRDYAFAYCTSLTSVTCFATTPPRLSPDVFEEVDKSIPLYVPAGSISAYQSAYQWKDFFNILPVGSQGIEEIEENCPQDSKILHNGQILILRGEKVYTLQGQEVR